MAHRHQNTETALRVRIETQIHTHYIHTLQINSLVTHWIAVQWIQAALLDQKLHCVQTIPAKAVEQCRVAKLHEYNSSTAGNHCRILRLSKLARDRACMSTV